MIKVETQNQVTTLTLDRPEIHNAFNDEMIKKITDEFQKIEQSSTRLVIITGSGKSFCAGADLNWMKRMKDYSEKENFEDSQKLALMFEAINSCSKPVIGKINGHALGGGAGLLAVCDYVVCQDRAKIGFTEVRLGLIPAVISPYVLAKIGESEARASFLSGSAFTPQHALKTGLVHKVVSLDELESEIELICKEFLQAGPQAQAEAKKLIKGLKKEKEIMTYTCQKIAKLRTSDEGQEGMQALLEKRRPQWT